MSFPLAKLNNNDLISVLNKMEFHSFINIRKTTAWLRDFVDKNRTRIKTQLHLDWIDKICIGRFGKQAIPNEELKAVRPKRIMLNSISKERVLSLDFKKFPPLEMLETWCLDEEAVSALLDKLDLENVPTAIDFFVDDPFTYDNSITRHPVFKKIKDIKLSNSCSSPDLSFLCANHGAVHLIVSEISDILLVINVIKMIAAGTNSTRYIGIKAFRDLDAVEAAIDMDEMDLVWSEETHRESYFKDWDPQLLSDSFAFYSIPVAGGKVGGLCVCLYGNHLRFKIFDTMEKYLERIPLGSRF